MPSRVPSSGSVIPPQRPHLPDEESLKQSSVSSGPRDISVVGAEGQTPSEDGFYTPAQSLDTRNPQVVGGQPLIQIDEPPAVEETPSPQTVALPAKAEVKSSFFERLLASVIIWVLDFKKVRAKVNFRRAAVVRQLNKRLKWVKKAIRNKPRKKTLDERRVLKRQLMQLRKEKKQARAARDSEIRSYLQLLRSLKALHKGEKQEHTVHLEGLVLEGGKATLRNVELRVHKVELVDSDTGETYPKITVDVKGSVDVNAPGQPPLKMDVEIKDMEASIQGRMVPGINAYIRGKGITGLFKALHRIRKQKGKFFQLSRAGVSVGKIKASLDELDPRTLIAIKGSSKTTVKEDISKMFSVLGHPFDLTVHEFEVARKGVPAPLARMEELKLAYELKPVESSEGETKRTLTVKADVIEVDTGGASDALYGIAREKKLKPMGLLPSGKEGNFDWITELEKQSTSLSAKVRDLNLQMKMHVSKDEEDQMVAGDSDLEFNAGHLEFKNRGTAQVSVDLDDVHFEGKLTGDKTEFSGRAETFSAGLGLSQKLGAGSNSIDCHSDFTGKDLSVSGGFHQGQVQTDIETGLLTVDTHGKPSSIHLGNTRIELPANLGGQVQTLSAHLRGSDKGDSELKVGVGKTHFAGEGLVAVNTRASKISVPVRGDVTLDQCDISTVKFKEGDLSQSVVMTEVTPGNISIDGVKASSVKVGNLTTELDEQRSGYVYLNDVSVNGDDLIQDLEQLPEATRQKVPTGFLKGRKLKASVKVKVENGLMDPKTAEFISYEMDETGVDKSAWTQWASWDQWFRSGLIGAAKWASVKGMNVSNGQLYLSLGIGPLSYPISVMKAPDEAVRGEKLSLPVLLHHYTGVCWGEVSKDDREFVDKINAGDLQALSTLAAYCRQVGPDRAERLLKMLQLEPWIERSKAGDQLSLSYLKTLTGLLFEYPGTAGRGLMLFRSFQWPITKPLAEALLKPAYRSHIDPVALALSVAQEGFAREAYEVLDEALGKKPEDPRLNYHACVVLRKWVESIKPDEMREDDREHLIIESARRLSVATRKQYPAALALQKQLCEEQEPYALLAEAGALLTHVHKPSAFYKALNRLEQMAALEEGIRGRAAKTILANRIKNSPKIFIHPTAKVEKSIHALEKRIKHKGMHGTKPDELYRLGIRYLYGVEGKVSNPARAIELLKQASKRGEHRAQLHLELAESALSEMAFD
ncbi:SEL1-like repeat protein [Endozoicomonas arenosclerae]|uniref:SEL1-like repeat protein n=1 Tax=Endozoicomonas arenosclerae TaxID=1633495 RepID=UPI0007851104|nr:SEL1-like repeat protein [Endozoicomonas arenosclerae]